MGQAKQRGSQQQRIEQAKAEISVMKPEKIVCNNCSTDIFDVEVMDSRGMPGIKAAFAGLCVCGHPSFALLGSAEAVADATAAMQKVFENEGPLMSGKPVPMTGLHVIINETKTSKIVLDQFPCAECEEPVFPGAEQSTVFDQPVKHSLQFGDCTHCGTKHLVASAETKADCIALEPVVKKITKSIGM
jgi:hypothetical protein